MSRCWHSSTSYFGSSSSYRTNSSTAVSLKSLIGKDRLEDALDPFAVERLGLVAGFQEQVVRAFLNLDQVRHLQDFADLAIIFAEDASGQGRSAPCDRFTFRLSRCAGRRAPARAGRSRMTGGQDPFPPPSHRQLPIRLRTDHLGNRLRAKRLGEEPFPRQVRLAPVFAGSSLTFTCAGQRADAIT